METIYLFLYAVCYLTSGWIWILGQNLFSTFIIDKIEETINYAMLLEKLSYKVEKLMAWINQQMTFVELQPCFDQKSVMPGSK